MQGKTNKEYASTTDVFTHSLAYVMEKKSSLPRSYQHDLTKLQALQQCTHEAMQTLREHEAQKKYSAHVLRVAKEVYDNLLFYENNDFVRSIKTELSTQKQRDFDFKFKLGESEVSILEQRDGIFVELMQEDKEEVLSLLWEITLQKIENLTQSVSAHRKDTIMNIKRTSFNSSPLAQSGGANSSATSNISRTYATSQLSGLSGVSESQSVARGDSIHVSTEGLLRTEAYRTASTSSDIRQKKVDDIKEKIASGTYIIDTKQLAFNLLREEASLLL